MLFMYMMQPSLIYRPTLRRDSISGSISCALPSGEESGKHVQIEASLINEHTHCFLQSRYALRASEVSDIQVNESSKICAAAWRLTGSSLGTFLYRQRSVGDIGSFEWQPLDTDREICYELCWREVRSSPKTKYNGDDAYFSKAAAVFSFHGTVSSPSAGI